MQPFTFPQQTHFYRGKVRDVYTIAEKTLVMVASNRISAFDVILPAPIPYKGQILNEIAAYMLHQVEDICPHWLLSVPLPHVSIGKKCEPLKVEMVVRGNLTGHSLRIYQSGERYICGVSMPEGMHANDFFPTPIITPTTKADEGHDEDISKEEIIARKIVSEKDYEILETYSHALFQRGKKIAAQRGLILADTKYEFGKIGDEIYLMDEIHTPDSSRYFYADGFEERQSRGEKQIQLSKEFVREWLMENNFMGQTGQVPPEMNEERIAIIRDRYIELFEKITGKKFQPVDITEEETEKIIIEDLKRLSSESLIP